MVTDAGVITFAGVMIDECVGCLLGLVDSQIANLAMAGTKTEQRQVVGRNQRRG